MPRTSFFLRLLLLLIVLLVLSGIKMCYGSISFAFADLWSALSADPETDRTAMVLFRVRLPELITSILAGSGLAVSGLMMQTLFRNPLAGPSVLGLSSGASLGTALVVLVGGVGMMGQVSAAMLGAVAVLVIILLASFRLRSVVTLLILGLMIGYIVSAVVSVLQFYADERSISRLVYWGMGSFGGVYGGRLELMSAIVLPLSLGSVALARPLDAYLLGEEQARSLGIDVRTWRWVIISVVGILTGLITALCGPIAFVGLAVPHMARLYFKLSGHRYLLIGSALSGAVVALFADIISGSMLFDQGVPLNSVLALIGAPMVIWLIWNPNRDSALT